MNHSKGGSKKGSSPTKSQAKSQNVNKANLNVSKSSASDFQDMMAENSSKAKALRANIVSSLEQMTLNADESSVKNETVDPKTGKSKTLDATNLEIKQILEKTIKDKLNDLEEALKEPPVTSVSQPDVSSMSKKASSPRPSKDKSPEAVAVAANGVTPSVNDIHWLTEKDFKSKNVTKDQKSTTSLSSQNRRNGPKSFSVTQEQVLKSLPNGDLQAKFDTLISKHVSILEELKNYESNWKSQEKVTLNLVREKELLQSDHNRTVLAKSRLENLCRELQRQNKAIKDESICKIKEEEEKRKEIAAKFQATLSEIMTLVQENQDRNVALKFENSELANKLRSLMAHYESWETNIHKIVTQKELEGQLLIAKSAQANLQFNSEKELFLEEKSKLIELISQLQRKNLDSAATESILRAELSMYTSKYQEFQEVLTKSNDTFSTFKKDMDKMSKQVKKLEKETSNWKCKFESTNRSLLDITNQKEQLASKLATSESKVDKLEKLCRALQEERTNMLSKISKLETKE